MDRTGVEKEVSIHAAIDIGTNTILMVAGSRKKNGSLHILADELAFARLGKNVDREGRIQPEAFERSEGVLQDFITRARSLGATRIIACGTSALRDASNREEYLSHVRRKFGIDIKVLDKGEEAQLSYRGALIETAATPGEQFAVLDIGGGSTELAIGTLSELKSRRSWDIGAVRITERYFSGDPPSSLEITAASNHIRSAMGYLHDLSSITTIGVAGTVTTLAAMELGLAKFEAATIEGFQLRRENVGKIFRQLSRMDRNAIGGIPVMERGREDIILAGILILLVFMELASISSLRVSTRGLRYGILYESFETPSD